MNTVTASSAVTAKSGNKNGNIPTKWLEWRIGEERTETKLQDNEARRRRDPRPMTRCEGEAFETDEAEDWDDGGQVNETADENEPHTAQTRETRSKKRGRL